MLLLCALMLFLVPALLGILVTGIRKEGMKECKENENRIRLYEEIRYVYLIGVITMLLLTGAIVLAADAMKIAFHTYVWSYWCIVAMLVLVGILLFRRCLEECVKTIRFRRTDWIPVILFLLLIPNLIWFLPDTSNDLTMQTIRTTIYTDHFFEADPMTGQMLFGNVSLNTKINILPFFYAGFLGLTQATAGTFLYLIVPVWVLFLVYLVSGLWAELLFREKAKQRAVFLSLIGILFFFGNTLFTSPSFLLFHRGWTGESILVLVMLPFLFYLLSCQDTLKKARFWPVIFVMLSVYFIVPVQAANGYLLLTIAIWLLAKLIFLFYKKFL